MYTSSLVALALTSLAVTDARSKYTSHREDGTFFPEHPSNNLPGSNERSICHGSDASRPAKCYMDSEPDAYNKGKAVLRLRISTPSGTGLCTGWLLGCEGHFVTNHHCVADEEEAKGLSFELMAEGDDCSDECLSASSCEGIRRVTGLKFIKASSDYDYALLQIPEEHRDILASHGFLQFREEPLVTNEQIYVPQHPQGWGKRLSMHTSKGDVTRAIESDISTSCSPKSMGHNADTQGGSSGSPVLGYGSNLVVALHNCGGCVQNDYNIAVAATAVMEDMGNDIPACAKASGSPVVPPVPTPPPSPTPPPPDCAPGCTADDLADAWCDAACNNAACNFDDGSCNGCEDQPAAWADSDGDGCERYAKSNWCTPDGQIGSGWGASWGTPADYAVDGVDAFGACCACGGGSGVPAASPSPAAPPASPSPAAPGQWDTRADHVCRVSADDTTHDADGASIVVDGSKTFEECQELCKNDSNCKAVEWGVRGRCEKWFTQVGHFMARAGYTCSRLTN